MVPINCENGLTRCIPATYEERRAVKNLTEGGFLNFHVSPGSKALEGVSLPKEYLLSHFGLMVWIL